ncbi:Scr1 family TA system antitoxin-like transcriptional regulator [Streptomyces californicus]|uniref:Scr1 family TA system antitoxin-like transcriptional regulator n=1 Tax=Streptomyces californicus TaxID=67351 RepID=UPI003715B5E0
MVTDSQNPTPATSSVDAPAGAYNMGRPWPPRVEALLLLPGETKASYESDRQLAVRIVKGAPWIVESTLITRRHATTAGLVMARELGIRQFIDLGCGFPSPRNPARARPKTPHSEYLPPHIYDIAHTVHGAGTRVVYADIDRHVVGYADLELAEEPGTVAIQADARDVSALLTHPRLLETIDLDQPVGVLLHAVLEWCADDAATVLRDLHDLLPAGSALSLTHATGDDARAAMASVANAYAAEGFDYRPRPRAAIENLLGPWELLPPGLEPTALYRRDELPAVPEHLQTTRKLPDSSSHAYAAVTAPKPDRPEPTTVSSILAGQAARPPGPLLVGATLRALREQTGVDLASAAARMGTTPLALDLLESGGHRLKTWTGVTLRALGVEDFDSERLLERLLKHPSPWSELLPLELEELNDPFPGARDRANAVLRVARSVRAFAFDRIPAPFQTPAYATLFAGTSPHRAAHGALPAIPAPLAQEQESCGWTLVLDECLIDRAFGHPHVLAEQLGHLLHLAALPHITLRVLPLESPLAMPVVSLTEHTLAGGILWRVNESLYCGLAQGEPYRRLMDEALANTVSDTMTLQLLERARSRALAAAAAAPDSSP